MKKLKVWDPAVRLFHWALTLLVLGAFLTAEEDETIPVHARIGLVVVGLIVFRLVWGFVGGRHVRFSSFVRSPREVLAYTRDYVRGRPPHHLGHNPLGAMMVVALLGTLALATATGALVYLGPGWDGPLTGIVPRSAGKVLEEIHEGAAGLLPVLIAFHVAGVLLSSVLERQNLVLGMLTGFKRGAESEQEPPTPARRAAGFIAAVVLGVLAAWGLGTLLPISEAEAAPAPRSLLESWVAEARSQDASFATPDPAAGRALYTQEHSPRGKPVSCVTCHTADPRQEGKSPAGKLIEPLAPTRAPERFTDRAHADKWFDRNCKQVLGRVCSPAEKANVLAYLLTF